MIAPELPPVLVVGCPRSGTTWVATMLGGTEGVTYVNEPDEISVNTWAVRARRGLGPLPDLGAGVQAPVAYRTLWDATFGPSVHRRVRGPNFVARRLIDDLSRAEQLTVLDPTRPRRSARAVAITVLAQPLRIPRGGRRLAKSVQVALALDWLRARYRPAIVMVRRHPLDVTASFLSQPWVFGIDLIPTATRARYCDAWGAPVAVPAAPLQHAAWTTGFIMSVLHADAARHPEVVSVAHEDLCANPHETFRDLAAQAGLEWRDTDAARLDASNRPDPHHRAPFRIIAEQPGKWKTRLGTEDQRAAVRILREFPIAAHYDEVA